MTHPVRVVVTDDLRRSRLTVLFRIVLVIPHLLWATLWAYALVFFVPFQWLWALFAGRVEDDAHHFLGRFVRYHAHIYAYLLLLADPWPSFHGRPAYPVDVELDEATSQGRAGVFFRAVLAIPAFIFASVLAVVLYTISFLGWFAALALGRLPEGMEELGAYCLRYQTQTIAYVLLLTPAYPSLAGSSFARPVATPATRERE